MKRALATAAVLLASLGAGGASTAGDEPNVEQALARALDDERHAIALYEAVMAEHGRRRPFSNIVNAERRHEASLLAQFQRLGLDVPQNAWEGREIPVAETFAETCDAAVVAEIRNIAMYDELLVAVDDEQVREAFRRLRSASQERHLPAFRRHGNGWANLPHDDLTPAQTEQLARAKRAKEDMFAALFARLTTTIESEGVAAAIGICSDAAPEIGARIAGEHGVRIGRTSWKLRNPSNGPPVWAELLVDERPTESRAVADRSGRLGALFPIRVNAGCLHCHGPRDGIAPDVRAQLSRLYPDDRATGFEDGDLRGWFWVEVPARDD